MQPQIAPITIPHKSPVKGEIPNVIYEKASILRISAAVTPVIPPKKVRAMQESKARAFSLFSLPTIISLPSPSICEMSKAALPAASLSEKYAVSFRFTVLSFLSAILFAYKVKKFNLTVEKNEKKLYIIIRNNY